MDEVERANILPTPRSAHIEYLIHGKFKRSDTDLKGVFGAWYVPLEELKESLGATHVQEKVEAFETALREVRVAAFATAADEDED